MSNIFDGHAPLMSGLFLLNLDRSDTDIHNIEAKRCKVNTDSVKTGGSRVVGPELCV